MEYSLLLYFKYIFHYLIKDNKINFILYYSIDILCIALFILLNYGFQFLK
jgi:hypothetical protein